MLIPGRQFVSHHSVFQSVKQNNFHYAKTKFETSEDYDAFTVETNEIGNWKTENVILIKDPCELIGNLLRFSDE